MTKTLPLKKLIVATMIVGGVALLFVSTLFRRLLFFLLLLPFSVSDIPPIITAPLAAVLAAAIALRLRRRSPRLLIAFLTVATALSCWWAVSLWENRDVIAKYGVSYKKSSGAHEEYQTIWFHWDRNGKRINGPEITGDDLYIRFKHVAPEEAPQIVVRSDLYKADSITLKLNFTDPNRPEFEIVENQGMNIQYPQPWDKYYRRDKETNEMQPVPR